MIDVTGQVLGSEKVTAKLMDSGVGYSQRVPMTVHALGLDLLSKVKDGYLTGGALNVRSGRLRRSTNEKFTEDGTTFTSSVGTNVAYARFWELGFHGLEEVKAFARMQTVAFGLPMKNPHLVDVKAHSRNVNQDARPFLQPALADMKDEIRARLTGAINGSN
jgi:phage gpG-like protein